MAEHTANTEQFPWSQHAPLTYRRFQLRNNFLLGAKNLVPNPFLIWGFTVHVKAWARYNALKLYYAALYDWDFCSLCVCVCVCFFLLFKNNMYIKVVCVRLRQTIRIMSVEIIECIAL